MRCLPLVYVLLTVAMTACVAFTQYNRVEFVSARTMNRRPFEKAMSTRYAYCDSTVTIEDEKEILRNRMPAPMDENMTKYQVEFRELLTGILYTEKELQTVLNPRLRAILEGIAASYYEPDVYRAFEILYEDYIPLRVAGRVVYRQLRKVMDESLEYQQSQIDTIINVTGMSRSDIEDCWSTYAQMTNDRKLSISQLEKYMEPQTLNFVLNSNVVSDRADSEEIREISFDELLIGLHDCNIRRSCDGDTSSDTISTGTKSVGNILEQALILNDGMDRRKSEKPSLSPKYQKFDERYDEMLVQFSKWKPLIPSGEGRRLQILKGCFTGSENPAVVEALRIIYVDYAALRLSGDWIFKVVSALMGPIVRRHNRRQNKTLQP